MAGLDVITGIPTGRKVALALTLLALVGAGYYFLIYSSKQGELEDAKNSVQTLRNQNDAARRDYERYEQLTIDLANARKLAEQLHKKLPTRRDIEGFTSEINTLAKKAGLRLTNIVPEDEEDGPDFVRLPIKLEFRGTYHQVFHFFSLVDREVERPVNMENLSLTRSSSQEERNLLVGTVRATTFMAKELGDARQAASTPL